MLAAEEAERVAAADAILAAQAKAQEGFEFARAEELSTRRTADQEAYEWGRFSSCCARPDPREQRQVLGYELTLAEMVAPSLSDALDTAESHELIVREAELYRDWALSEGKTEDAEALVTCRRRVRELTETTVDRATAHLLHTADKHQNEDGEILVNCVRDDFKYALWMNHVKNPRFKAIEVPEFDGLLLELPKELSMATIAMRAFHRTYCEFESFEDAGQGSAAEEACDVADTSAPNEPTEVDASLNVPQGATEEASAEEPAMEEAEKENAAPAQTETTETDPAETKPEEEGGETKPTEDESGEEAPVEEAPVESEPEPVVAETKPSVRLNP